MENYEVVEGLYEQAKNNGLINTIKKFFGVGAKIRLPFSESTCATQVEDLNLSVRSYNCLKRAGLDTVEKVILIIQEDKLLNIRNLGKNSKIEINHKIYEFGYTRLKERAKREFLNDVYQLNIDKFNKKAI